MGERPTTNALARSPGGIAGGDGILFAFANGEVTRLPRTARKFHPRLILSYQAYADAAPACRISSPQNADAATRVSSTRPRNRLPGARDDRDDNRQARGRARDVFTTTAQAAIGSDSSESHAGDEAWAFAPTEQLTDPRRGWTLPRVPTATGPVRQGCAGRQLAKVAGCPPLLVDGHVGEQVQLPDLERREHRRLGEDLGGESLRKIG
jgi:hypothetical protein